MSGTGKETVPNTQLVIYELASWEVVFNGGESEPRQTTTIDNAPQSLIQLFQRLQKAEDDVRLLAATAANKDAMDIDVGDLREHYEALTRNATSLFQQFTLSIETQNTYTEGRFRQLVQNCQIFGHDVWTAIGGLRDDANGKEDAYSNRINRINDDVRLLKVGEDYWKTAVTEWAAQQEQRQLRIAEEIGNIREESHRRTHESHKEIAEQLRKEMKVQVEQLKKEQDEIMRRLREAEKKVDEADDENAETVYETEMEMLRNFHMRSGAPSPSPPQGKTPGTSWASRPEDKVKINYHLLHLHQQASKATMTNHSTPRKIAMWTSFVERFETSVETHPQTGSWQFLLPTRN
jgi:chromosome segregation ATPase